MDQQLPEPPPQASPSPDALSTATSIHVRKRSSSGAAGLFSKLPFMRAAGEHRPRSRRNTIESERAGPAPTLPPTPSFTTIPADVPSRRPVAAAAAAAAPPPHMLQEPQQKTRRRRGSLRKVALLGRGAQRERREARGLTIETKLDGDGTNGTHDGIRGGGPVPIASNSVPFDAPIKPIPILKNNGSDLPSLGLGISNTRPPPSSKGLAVQSAPSSNPNLILTPPLAPRSMNLTVASSTITPALRPKISYSTTDDEDALHMARPNRSGSTSRPTAPSNSESYFTNSQSRPLNSASGPNSRNGTLPSLHHRRNTIKRAKSPLALMSTTPLPQPDTDWDYSETEWWGWIILVVTWTVFVVGMGSCLGVWSWAWDVGTTPYAPPELEDDPTLPIVGYYPALMILTGVMAWVWVLVAWVGMKYFRHAQVSGD